MGQQHDVTALIKENQKGQRTYTSHQTLLTLVLSVVMEMFFISTIQYGSHLLLGAIEYLKCR